MDKKKNNSVLILLFAGFLSAMLAGLLLLPKQDFSEYEKRYLTEFPVPSSQSILSGSWGEDLEAYLADRLPGRNFFVGLNAYCELALGLQPTKDIRAVDGRLIEAPVTADPGVIGRDLDIINRFAESAGQEVFLALVPSCGWAVGDPQYPDADIIRQAQLLAGSRVHPIDLTDTFRDSPELYYRTDHHWNSAGAYAGWCRLMEAMGRESLPESAFSKELHPDCFRGSTYSRSALWLTPAEDLELWHGTPGITVQNRESGTLHQGVFYPERLEEADKYTVFLDGNHSVVTLHNPGRTGKLLVIRDSYSNSLGCFLAESYGEVVLADLRYFKSPISALVGEGFDDILICYSVGNFMTDTNLVLLR